MKDVVFRVLKRALKKLKVNIKDSELWNLIEIPPNQEMGDYSFPCFSLAGILKEESHEIALRVREEIGEPSATDFEDIQVSGPYVNFFLNRKSLAREVIWNIITSKKRYGTGILGKGKKTMVEFPSPNTNKPL